jgi:hypothetical protein
MTIHSLRNAAAWGLIAAVLAPLTSTAAFAEAAMSGSMKPLGSVRFAPDHDVRCLLSALESGDPAKGASTWILKAPAGCGDGGSHAASVHLRGQGRLHHDGHVRWSLRHPMG